MTIDHQTQAIYNAADALEISLSRRAKTLTSDTPKIHRIGNMKLSFPMKVRSDFLTENSTALIIHVREHLWAYLYSSKDPDWLWMVFLKGDDKTTDGTWVVGDHTKFLAKHHSKVVASFVHSKGTWRAIELKDLLG